jgi:hypothetical protein
MITRRPEAAEQPEGYGAGGALSDGDDPAVGHHHLAASLTVRRRLRVSLSAGTLLSAAPVGWPLARRDS